jgi:hypothetical protein
VNKNNSNKHTARILLYMLDAGEFQNQALCISCERGVGRRVIYTLSYYLDSH